jgi:putative restriction endonuclease
MLQHGLKERHRQHLMVVPRAKVDRPDPAMLEIEYESFRSA